MPESPTSQVSGIRGRLRVQQTRNPDRILIVDNASTDGTREMLAEQGWLARRDVELLPLDRNAGGAGGFSTGIAHATKHGADWIWIMDDDAIAHPAALATLIESHPDPRNLYGSTAVMGLRLAWPMQPIDPIRKKDIESILDCPERVEVRFIPFLGLLIHRQMVDRIGTPDESFFIAADDVDYCHRARSAGAKIILIRDSRITHPLSQRNFIWLHPWRKLYSLRLAPWKRYYDVRNRLLVAKRYYGFALYYSTVPGSFLRLFVTLLYEPERLAQVRAFFAGMCDGLRGRSGRRHEEWRL